MIDLRAKRARKRIRRDSEIYYVFTINGWSAYNYVTRQHLRKSRVTIFYLYRDYPFRPLLNDCLFLFVRPILLFFLFEIKVNIAR